MTEAIVSQKPVGRLVGACLLISGTAIGAAMLALPVSTGRAGLVPSLMTMGGVWLYLVLAAFYLLEMCLSMPREANLISMAEKTLGRPGKWITWAAYLFLLYALNTAYLFGMTTILGPIMQLDRWQTSIPLIFLFWALLRKGMRFIDGINRIGMVGFLAAFVLLVLCAIPHVSVPSVTCYNLSAVIPSFGVVLCAFGYHIVIPSLVSYLDRDVVQCKKAIWIGSGIAFVVYALWQFISLAVISDPAVLEAAYQHGSNSVQLISQASNSRLISSVDTSFAFFAMITSFFGVSVALVDFLKDGCRKKNMTSKMLEATVFAVGFLPPLYFALGYERIFLVALDFAGAYGVVVLLALVPACMVYSKRYIARESSGYQVCGSKALLVFFMAVSVALLLLQACYL